MIITIDGPAGSGKSTVAKRLAKKLKNFDFFDTGAMYRALTWFFLKHQVSLEDEKLMEENLEKFFFEIKKNGHLGKRYFVNGIDITLDIRSRIVTEKVALFAKKDCVRKFIVKMQKEFAKDKNIIFEGRDMGTVVFPDADLKFFLTASVKTRAKRRFLEIKEKFRDITFDLILKDLKERDFIDTTRKNSPLLCAKDANVINTTWMSIEMVVNKIYKRILKENKMHFFYRMVRSFFLFFFKIFYKLEIIGENNVIKGKAILASNHTSYFDPITVAISCKEELYFIAKSSLFNIFLFNKIIKKLNTYPVSRKASDIVTIKKIASFLKQGKKVVLFPEGRRSVSKNISNILKGAAYFSYLCECPIIPTYIHGTYDIWGRGKKLPRLFGRKIVCCFGKSIFLKKNENVSKKKHIEKINLKLEESLKELKDFCEKKYNK